MAVVRGGWSCWHGGLGGGPQALGAQRRVGPVAFDADPVHAFQDAGVQRGPVLANGPSTTPLGGVVRRTSQRTSASSLTAGG